MTTVAGPAETTGPGPRAASAAGDVVTAIEPISVDAQQIYRALF